MHSQTCMWWELPIEKNPKNVFWLLPPALPNGALVSACWTHTNGTAANGHLVLHYRQTCVLCYWERAWAVVSCVGLRLCDDDVIIFCLPGLRLRATDAWAQPVESLKGLLWLRRWVDKMDQTMKNKFIRIHGNMNNMDKLKRGFYTAYIFVWSTHQILFTWG